MLKIFRLCCIIMIGVAELPDAFSQGNNESVNLLLNPYFDFHSFINHREGKPVSYSSGNVAFWNTDAWGDIEVMRESHVADSIRPKFSTHNLVTIQPGKKIWQFFTLPEVGLAHGEHINLSVYGYQPKGEMIKAKIKLMKLDSEDGEWSPKTFGMTDDRTFPKHSRGELVVAKEYNTFQSDKGTVELTVENAEIIGKTSVGVKSSSKDINTIGIQIEFENTDKSEAAWIYSPILTKVDNGSQSVPESRRHGTHVQIYTSNHAKTMERRTNSCHCYGIEHRSCQCKSSLCIYMTRIRDRKPLNSLWRRGKGMREGTLMQLKQAGLILKVIMANGDIILVMPED